MQWLCRHLVVTISPSTRFFGKIYGIVFYEIFIIKSPVVAVCQLVDSVVDGFTRGRIESSGIVAHN